MSSNFKKLNITEFLPHKHPMLMVDHIVDIAKNQIITDFEIKDDNTFLYKNKLSEFGLIENAAQTCSSVVGQSFFFDDNGNILQSQVDVIGFISSVKNVILHKLPESGDVLKTKAVLNSRIDTDQFIICTLKCKTTCRDKVLLEADINLIIADKL